MGGCRLPGVVGQQQKRETIHQIVTTHTLWSLRESHHTITSLLSTPLPLAHDLLTTLSHYNTQHLGPQHITPHQAIVDAIRLSNNPPIPAHKVLGFTTRTAADEYMMTHPDGCLGALHLVRQQSLGDNATAFSYLVTSNSTVRRS